MASYAVLPAAIEAGVAGTGFFRAAAYASGEGRPARPPARPRGAGSPVIGGAVVAAAPTTSDHAVWLRKDIEFAGLVDREPQVHAPAAGDLGRAG